MRLSARERYFNARRGVITHEDLERERKAEAAKQARQETETKKHAKEAAKGAPLFGADDYERN